MWYAGAAPVFCIVNAYISYPLPLAAEGAEPPIQSISKLLVASSKKITSGSLYNALANTILCAWPPEIFFPSSEILSLIELGKIYEDENNFIEAKKYYFLALKIENNNYTVNFRIAKLLHNNYYFKEASEYYKKSIGFIRFKNSKLEII